MIRQYLQTADSQWERAEVHRFNTDKLESEGIVRVYLDGGYGVKLRGVAAIDFLMDHAPYALEGKNLRWRRWDWAFHNFVAHPLMQLLAFCHLHRWAFAVHDYTIPRPKGIKNAR